jgi:hypothetical protein
MTGIQLPCNRVNRRFKTDFAAKIESDFFCIRATITNMSRSGLQFECEQMSLQLIMPNVSRPCSHLPIELHIHFQVPTPNRIHTNIDITCSLIYVRRLSQHSALAGCRFSHFDDASEINLLEYINNFAVPF